MNEDKLTHDERLRLECLAQAVALYATKPQVHAEQVVYHAEVFESYVRGDLGARGA